MLTNGNVSTLFDDRFRVWPIVMIMQSYRKQIDNVFDVRKINLARCS